MEGLNSMVHTTKYFIDQYAKRGKKQLKHAKKVGRKASLEAYHAVADFVTHRPVLSIAIAGVAITTVVLLLLKDHHPVVKKSRRRG